MGCASYLGYDGYIRKNKFLSSRHFWYKLFHPLSISSSGADHLKFYVILSSEKKSRTLKQVEKRENCERGVSGIVSTIVVTPYIHTS